MDRTKLIIVETKPDDLSTMFLRGLTSGWNKTNPTEVAAFLDNALCDPTWGAMFPELQIAIGLDDLAHSRLIRCLECGKASSGQFQHLRTGRVTDSLSVEQVALLLSQLATKPDNGVAVAIDVLNMVIHCADNKNEEYLFELKAYCSKFMGAINWALIDLNDDNLTRDLERIIEFGLSGTASYEEASQGLNSLIHFELANANFPRRLGRILMPFFKRYPEEAMDACYFQDSDGHYNSALRLVSVEFAEHENTAISVVGVNPTYALPGAN